MTGIVMPQDRVVKQPAEGFCRNPECRERSDQEYRFRVEHDRFSCPKCGANSPPMVGVMVLTHLLVRHSEGHVLGSGGLRYRIACDSRRAYLATVTNQEAATDDPGVVNCPGCLAAAESLGVKASQGWAFLPEKKEG